MIYLIGGGARSGKSTYAEELIAGIPGQQKIYIATMEPGDDPENHARIAKHRAQREDKGFATIECQTGLSEVTVPEGCTVLLECLANLLSNEMFSPSGAGRWAEEEILLGIDRLCARASQVFLITNDLYGDGESYAESVEQYRRSLAAISRYAAERADVVVELCAGIPVIWKSSPTHLKEHV